MSEFCTKCAKSNLGEKAIPEIDVEKIFESLDPGFVDSGFICESCGLVAVSKTESGELKVMRVQEEKPSFWEEY